MKLTSLTFLAVAAACGLASAQTTAYTTPVGYTTQTMKPSVFNNVGFNIVTPSLAAGAISDITNSGLTLTDSQANFNTALVAGKMHTVEISSGPSVGYVFEFTSWTNTTINLVSAIPGLQIGDKYIVRQSRTLQGLFPSGAPLTGAALNPTNADVVWVPNGSGGYTQYWYKTSATQGAIGWWTTVDGTTRGVQVTSDVPLLYTDCLLVQRKTGLDQNLVLTGDVKKTPTIPYILTNFNRVSINPPVGLTLFSGGFYPDNFTGAALTPTNADVLWVPDGLGGYTQYWYKTSATQGAIGWWTTVDGTTRGVNVTVDVDLPPGCLIQRKSTPKFMKIAVPSSYSNL